MSAAVSRQAARAWALEHREEMVRDVMRLVRIPSVAEPAGSGAAPFGPACAEALAEGLALCREHGFSARNLAGRCGVALWPGKTAESLGIFSHLDVVPAGEGWASPPFEPRVENGYIIGRGSGDNKGPAVAALYALRCLKELGAGLEHSVQLYLGCSEETGMADLMYYTQHEPQPVFSLVPDVNFPVCCGEKGILTADLTCRVEGSNLLGFGGGVASNAVPDRAFALLAGVPLTEVEPLLAGAPGVEAAAEGGKLRLTARGIAGHAAFPEGTESAIQKLAAFLAQNALVTGPAAGAMAFLAAAFGDAYGEGLDIDFRDEVSGRTTHVGGMARLDGGVLTQNINVRYCVRADQAALIRRLKARCSAGGFAVERLHNDPPCYTPPQHPAIAELLRAYEAVYGGGAEPYVMGGGTYARKLKNAVGFGPGVPDPAPLYGGGHQPNEGVRIQLLTNMIEIYADALQAIDRLV